MKDDIGAFSGFCRGPFFTDDAEPKGSFPYHEMIVVSVADGDGSIRPYGMDKFGLLTGCIVARKENDLSIKFTSTLPAL